MLSVRSVGWAVVLIYILGRLYIISKVSVTKQLFLRGISPSGD